MMDEAKGRTAEGGHPTNAPPGFMVAPNKCCRAVIHICGFRPTVANRVKSISSRRDD